MSSALDETVLGYLVINLRWDGIRILYLRDLGNMSVDNFHICFSRECKDINLKVSLRLLNLARTLMEM